MRRRALAMMLLGVVLGAPALSGCGTLDHRAVPEALADEATLVGIPDIRSWGDKAPADLPQQIAWLEDKVRRRVPDAADAAEPRTLDHLAISGGGEYGAFGAGLLAGWTAFGGRPEFQTVTGVSVGAIIAPFAFLGPRYDARLRALIDDLGEADNPQPELLAALFGVAFMDNGPLKRLIRRHVTAEMLDEIAVEHGKGRQLLIGTTNLHAARPVIWDIGKLAVSGHPEALDIFQRILLASAAIPGAFAPVTFEVEAGGRRFDELHVDGTVTTVVFFYPAQIRAAAFFTALPFRQRLYIIRNRKLTPDYTERISDLLDVSQRAIDTVVQFQGNGDLYQMYLIAKRDGVDYNLSYIPVDFHLRSSSLFDHNYMQSLYDFGYSLGKNGYGWAKSPPGIDDP